MPSSQLSTAPRLVAVAALALVVLLPQASSPAAALDVVVDEQDGFVILAEGAISLAAPQNLTLEARAHGYELHWDPPSGLPGQADPVGYTLYRVPGPQTAGSTASFEVGVRRSWVRDGSPGEGEVFVYFVTAAYGGPTAGESIPSNPVSTSDLASAYPHCGVASVYTSPPYYDVQMSCLFPLPG